MEQQEQPAHNPYRKTKSGPLRAELGALMKLITAELATRPGPDRYATRQSKGGK